MKHDALSMTLLFDHYGELLTEKQKLYFDLYYNQDLSLAEIAESEGLSRQGVYDAIRRTEAILTELEEKTGCVARSMERKKLAAEILRIAGAADDLPGGQTVAEELRALGRRLEE